MAKKLITVVDFQNRHPMYLSCSTDQKYTALANRLYGMIADALGFMDDDKAIQQIAISMAQYFEDYVSRTHLFDVFLKRYQQLMPGDIPFADIDEVDDHEVTINRELRFVMWHAVCAERERRILNPCNPAVKKLVDDICLELLEDGTLESLPPNENLLDFLYSEETQTDAMEVKRVLMWLESGCYLGHWCTNKSRKYTKKDVKELLPISTPEDISYGDRSLQAFLHMAWPVSVPAQSIYADMIRMEMGDDNDELAKVIEEIEFKEMSIHKVLEYDNGNMTLQNFKKDVFCMQRRNFANLNNKTLKECRFVLSSFIKFDGEWYANGISAWYPLGDREWEDYCEKELPKYEAMHNYKGQYDKFLRKHRGKRLYYFRDMQDMVEWNKKELGIDLQIEQEVLGEFPADDPVMVFFEDNGQTTMSSSCRCIKAKDNPYYDKEYAQDNALTVLTQVAGCSPGCLRYILEKKLLPDAEMSSIKGSKHGRWMAQNNLEFLARCFRRDIEWQ